LTRLTAGPGTEAEFVKAVSMLAFGAELLYELAFGGLVARFL